MAQKSLTTSYLALLPNANHDGVSEQICERFTAFTTDNQMLSDAIALLAQRRAAEDAAYRRYTGKDFASDDLKREDALEDKYMSAIRAILKGILCLPEGEPMRRKAELAFQLYKDFDYHVSDGFEASARKILNMAQQWREATQYTLAELGVEEWVDKAVLQAQKIMQLITVRVNNESAKVKGELADARKATDDAIRRAYDIVNALNVLQPTAELTQLTAVLFGIEDRAKQYYINASAGSGQSGNAGGAGSGSSSSGGTGSGSGESGSGSGDSGSGSGDQGGGSGDSGSGSGDQGGGSGGSGSGSGDQGGDNGGSGGGGNYDDENGME